MSLGRILTRDTSGNWRTVDGITIAPPDPPPSVDTFVLGTTRATKANTGPDPDLGTLTPYTGPGAGGQLTISTAGAVYEGIDFGATNTRVRRNANDIELRNCNFVNKSRAIYSSDPGPLIDCRSGGFGGCYIYRCSFDNAHQWSPVMQAVMGYGFVMERCWAENFQDNIGVYTPSSAVLNLDVQLLGNYLGPLSWWYSPTGGQVHSSDTKSHNDVMQYQGGRNLLIDGNDIVAKYSTTIGTGTPNSGSDTLGLGANLAPYTQAAGVAKRYEIVEGSGTYSAGKPGAFLGGSLSGLMFTPVGGRNGTPAAIIKRNWCSGGAFFINAGSTALVNTAGIPYTFEVTGNRFDNNQRQAGWAVGITSQASALVPQTGPDVNLWTDGSGIVPRKNA